MTEGVALNVPLVPLNMDLDTSKYVGMLEGTIAALVINECKYRALLELLTGEDWEATKVDINGQALMDIAVSSLVKQTGIGAVKAKTIVVQRWNDHNQLIDVTVPQAVSPADLVAANTVATPTPVVTAPVMSDRYREWVDRQKAAADALPDKA